MKKSFVLILTVISFNVFAADEAKLLMRCEERFSGLDKIEFYQARDGRIYGLQYEKNANEKQVNEFAVDPIAFEKKTNIDLVSWYGYERVLSLKGNEWTIEYQDECSGGSMVTRCTEYK